MNEQEKLDALAEIFETADLVPETALDDLNWDSVAMLSVIALARTQGKSVPAESLPLMKSIADILSVL